MKYWPRPGKGHGQEVVSQTKNYEPRSTPSAPPPPPLLPSAASNFWRIKMTGHKHQEAKRALNIRCSVNARAMLEQLLGPPTAVVGIGESELCMHYGLTAPVE